MQFNNRSDAGIKLAKSLEKYRKDPNAVVIGLPRGGVITAHEVAKELQLPLDIICPRKIGAPMNAEFAIGAITETGEGIFHRDIIEEYRISEDYIQKKIEEEKEMAKKRLKIYRQGRNALQLVDKTVIIVDDGIATGATMEAAIISIKKGGASKVVVAVPVAPKTTLQKLLNRVDELTCLMTPPGFYAVGQFYKNFAPIQDSEVIQNLHLLSLKNAVEHEKRSARS